MKGKMSLVFLVISMVSFASSDLDAKFRALYPEKIKYENIIYHAEKELLVEKAEYKEITNKLWEKIEAEKEKRMKSYQNNLAQEQEEKRREEEKRKNESDEIKGYRFSLTIFSIILCLLISIISLFFRESKSPK